MIALGLFNLWGAAEGK